MVVSLLLFLFLLAVKSRANKALFVTPQKDISDANVIDLQETEQGSVNADLLPMDSPKEVKQEGTSPFKKRKKTDKLEGMRLEPEVTNYFSQKEILKLQKSEFLKALDGLYEFRKLTS